MVCQTGMIAPPTAFLTDGTSVVRVRSSHHITAAMEAPTVTEIARRMAGTLNGPDSCAFSMYPSAKRSTWYSMSVSKPAAAPIAMPTTATAAISAGMRLMFGRGSVSSCDCFDIIASPTLRVPRLQSISSFVSTQHHRSTHGGLMRRYPSNMNRNIDHTACVCIVNGRSGSSSSATRPATSAKHHKAYSGRFIGGKYIGIYSIQDTRCTK